MCIYEYITHMTVLLASMEVHHMCSFCPQRIEEDIKLLRTGVTTCKQSCGCCEWNAELMNKCF